MPYDLESLYLHTKYHLIPIIYVLNHVISVNGLIVVLNGLIVCLNVFVVGLNGLWGCIIIQNLIFPFVRFWDVFESTVCVMPCHMPFFITYVTRWNSSLLVKPLPCHDSNFIRSNLFATDFDLELGLKVLCDLCLNKSILDPFSTGFIHWSNLWLWCQVLVKDLRRDLGPILGLSIITMKHNKCVYICSQPIWSQHDCWKYNRSKTDSNFLMELIPNCQIFLRHNYT